MAIAFPVLPGIPGASERITTFTSAKGLTAATYNLVQTVNDPYQKTRHPVAALVTVAVGAMKWTSDGTTPTVTAGTAIGHIAGIGDLIPLTSYQEIQRFLAINEVASNGAVLDVTYRY